MTTRTTAKWRRWVTAVLLTAVTAGVWSEPAGALSLGRIFNRLGDVVSSVTGLGGGNSAIIANQMTQIQRMSSVLEDTTELPTSNDIGMGNIGRLRELREQDFYRRYLKNGLAQSTALGAPEELCEYQA